MTLRLPIDEKFAQPFPIRWFLIEGAAEDGRAPTEERARVNGWGFRSMGRQVIRVQLAVLLNEPQTMRWSKASEI